MLLRDNLKDKIEILEILSKLQMTPVQVCRFVVCLMWCCNAMGNVGNVCGKSKPCLVLDFAVLILQSILSSVWLGRRGEF